MQQQTQLQLIQQPQVVYVSYTIPIALPTSEEDKKKNVGQFLSGVLQQMGISQQPLQRFSLDQQLEIKRNGIHTHTHTYFLLPLLFFLPLLFAFIFSFLQSFFLALQLQTELQGVVVVCTIVLLMYLLFQVVSLSFFLSFLCVCVFHSYTFFLLSFLLCCCVVCVIGVGGVCLNCGCYPTAHIPLNQPHQPSCTYNHITHLLSSIHSFFFRSDPASRLSVE